MLFIVHSQTFDIHLRLFCRTSLITYNIAVRSEHAGPEKSNTFKTEMTSQLFAGLENARPARAKLFFHAASSQRHFQAMHFPAIVIVWSIIFTSC